jgi:hypothetical protein
MNNFWKRLGGSLLTLALVFGVYAAASDSIQAQYRIGQYQRRNNDQNGEWRNRRRDDSQRAQEWRWRRSRDLNRSERYRRYDNNDAYRNNRGYGNYGGYGNSGGYNNSSQYELNRGYQQGLNTGASDAQRGQSFSPQRSRYYQNPSSQAFRQGFVQGYNQGYRQYAGYGNQRNRNGGGILGGIFGRR